MQSTSFVALAGHLNEYPLADLISILRRQRKTGRLLIEYPIGPCSLYLWEGDLVDAQLNSMSGLQAVMIALAQPNASFNFNPLIEPPRRSINEASQKVILELLGCWEEKPVDVEANAEYGGTFSAAAPLPTVTTTVIETEPEALPAAKELLALPPSSLERASRRRHRQLLIASAIISLLVSFLTVIGLTRWLVKRDIAVAISELEKRNNGAGVRQAERDGASAQPVKVSVRVENGRVTQAFVEEHRPGMEDYEALALRIARMRRYSATASGQSTVLVRINSPD
ncbi:MAG TPA: DUF4388 domain-containing protein [Pyrinomonadaceae bacterium]|jgi:hypothetical protein